MGYFLLIIAAVLLALNFATNKVYQVAEGASLRSALKFNIVLGFFTTIIFFCINGLQFKITTYSLVMGMLTTFFSTAYLMLSFSIMKSGHLSLYTLFLMTGGMIIPYIWGVAFLDEEITFLRTLGLLMISLSVFIMNSSTKKTGLKTLLMCIAVFLLNGAVSVVSKLHQINPASISSSGFVLLTGIIKFVVCLILLVAINKLSTENNNDQQKTSNKIPPKMLGVIFVSAAISGVSYLLQLIGAKDIDATVLYPIITGGSIFFTTLAGWIFFKEKPTAKVIASVVICFLGTCLFL